MPIYLFQNPQTEETIELFFGMNDEKKYVDEDGTEWNRLYYSPQLSTEASIDPWSNSDFVNKTANMKGTVGDMMDKSAELSSIRAEKNGGVDPVKEKYFNKYAESRRGQRHPSEKKGSTYESKNVKIEFD